MIGAVQDYTRVEDIDLTQSIRKPIADVFRAMTVPKLVDEWGGGPARIQARVNGKYSLWDGEMYGLIKEIEFPRRLVYTMRESSWDPSQLDSLVSWDFRESVWGTELTLHHTGLPTRKIREIHNDGWGDYFLGPLKAYMERKQRVGRKR